MRLRTALLAALVASAPIVAAAVAYAAGPLPAPAANQGQVVFYKEPMFGLLPNVTAWTIQENDKALAKLYPGSYAVVTVPPGKHSFYLKSETTDTITLEVDEGETYYVKQRVGMGLVTSREHLTPSTEADFGSVMHKLHVAKPLPPGA
jgi:hypothetical protein